MAAGVAAPGWQMWREPSRGAFPDPRLFLLPAALRELAGERGKWPPPPLSRLTGIVYASADEESTVWTQPVTQHLLSSQGTVPGGLLAVIADMALGSVVGRTLPSRTMFSTSEMSFNFTQPATMASGEITAVGSLTVVQGRLALSRCVISGSDGGVLAQATARNVVAKQLPESAPGPDLDDAAAVDAFIDSLALPEAIVDVTPDPYLRATAGVVLPREAWGAGGLAVLQAQIAGELPMPPVHHLTGIRPTAASEGVVSFAMPASGWLASGFPSVQGGFLAFLAYSALASAVQTTTLPGEAHVPVDLKINLLRPVFPDPELRDLTATGRVIHRGRTLSVADAEVRGVDGQVVAVGRGTSMLTTELDVPSA
ncbi:MAG: hypothetical protein QOJ92_992 [Frankiales bacterium]|nr:hypothetical protein [Frankiales bacterium]